MNTTKPFFYLSLVAALTVAEISSTFAQDKPKSTEAGKTSVSNVDANGADKLIKEKKAVVLDIRTPDEFSGGHIAGAVNIDFYAKDFDKKLGELDKSKTYLVHCASGGRSTKSLDKFQHLKFQSVVHLDGGFKAWEKAGKPVAK
jgi:phage shock protein E